MAKEILIFSVAGRQYGIEVKELQSIENYIPPTSVSNGPEFYITRCPTMPTVGTRR